MTEELEGLAESNATATGALSMATAIEGLASASAAASGDLSPHPLAGSAQAVATAAGALASLIKLTADAEVGATASGSPDVLVAIAGAASALAAASAALSQSVLLSGNAATLATAAGAITQQFGITGAAVGQAGATGTLDTVSNLEGDAAALATLTGALDQSLAVAGVAQVVATAAGNLSNTIAMQGAASAKASATGSLGVNETVTGGITYAVNLDTGSVTTWNNCAFERLVTAHGKLYGLLAGVLYRIEGDVDPGSVEIKSQVRFAQSNFGSTTLNRLYKVYMTSREIEQAEVTPIYDETTSLSYTSIPDLLSGMITHRTNIGRGNRWRTLGLQVANKQGGQLDIGGLELLIQPLVPRIP